MQPNSRGEGLERGCRRLVDSFGHPYGKITQRPHDTKVRSRLLHSKGTAILQWKVARAPFRFLSKFDHTMLKQATYRGSDTLSLSVASATFYTGLSFPAFSASFSMANPASLLSPSTDRLCAVHGRTAQDYR